MRSSACAVGGKVLEGRVECYGQLRRIALDLGQHEASLDGGEARSCEPVGVGGAVQLAGSLHRVQPAPQVLLPALERVRERDTRLGIALRQLAHQRTDGAAAARATLDLELDE